MTHCISVNKTDNGDWLSPFAQFWSVMSSHVMAWSVARHTLLLLTGVLLEMRLERQAEHTQGLSQQTAAGHPHSPEGPPEGLIQ